MTLPAARPATGIPLGLILSLLSAIHVYWARGGQAGKAQTIPTREGRPTIDPGPAITLAVAAALAAAALFAFARGGLAPFVPERLARLATAVMGLVFAARAIGDFHTVGLFKDPRGSTFARWDSLLFSPLCAVMALLSAGSAR